MNRTQQTDAFVAALLKHCKELEVQAIRDIGTPEEKAGRVYTVTDLEGIDRLRGKLGHENASRAGQILARPAADEDHPWLFLDDVPTPLALRISGKYAALVVETTPGNCQIRLLGDRPMNADARFAVQVALVGKTRRAGGGDLGSVSGVKMGRLPGFRNRKQGRDCWTNLLADTTSDGRPFEAVISPPKGGRVGYPIGPACADGDRGYMQEFAFACARLRDGLDCGEVSRLIADHALRRGKRKTWREAMKYAERTVAAALARPR